ncbi:unnamed protein product [Durusdinium trenchii]|uniref:Polymerase nucleotidyl transferase domain-containing protein n=2 Tax=Durusdinium trenchii TaxID=1381693 RepID=A0ABP0K7X1_9DINO
MINDGWMRCRHPGPELHTWGAQGSSSWFRSRSRSWWNWRSLRPRLRTVQRATWGLPWAAAGVLCGGGLHGLRSAGAADAEVFQSPGQMLRSRRQLRRQRLSERLQLRWQLSSCCGPGRLARLGRFERFAPENFRIHFLASSHGTDRAWQVSEVLSVFQQISAAAKRQLPTFCCSAGRCESPPGDVDLLVCMDETSAAERAEEVQLGEICCLADFLDACPIEEQLTQLDHLVEMDRVHWHSLQPELLARVRSLVDWDEDPEDLLQTAQALAAAGLHRFLISQFPEHLKELQLPCRPRPFAFGLS